MRKKEFLKWLLVMILVTGISNIAVAGNLQRKLSSESVIEQIVKRGVIRVGMDIFVPWAMKDKNGKLVGFEIDVAKELAKDMGVKVEFIPTKWSGIIPALITGKFDVIIGGMSVTPKRNLKINFTNPYYYSYQALLANKKMTKGFKLTDFNSPDVTIAARLGSTGAIAAKRNFPKAKLRLFDDEPSAVQEVRNGKVHAMVSSQPLPAHTALKYPDTLVSYDVNLMKEPICFGVKKGDYDALNYFNNWIEIKRSKGWIQDRHKYWFLGMDWKGLVQ